MQIEMILPEEEFSRYSRSDTKPNLAEGYRLRTYRYGDGGSYLALMKRVGFDWDEKMLNRTLNSMLPDGLFFVEHEATASIVATTVAGHGSSAFHPMGGELGWVGVDPEHRGKRLGIVVCDAVLRRFIEAGYQDILLRTDEYRLPALKTYLDLGFRPLIRDDEMAERWTIAFGSLGMSAADLETCAVEAKVSDSARDGYRPWNPPDRSETGDEPSERDDGLRVGFLPLYLELYDRWRPEMRTRFESFQNRVVRLLRSAADSGAIEIVDVPVATTRRDIDSASERFGEGRVDLVVTLHLAYSPSLLAADLLANLEVPVLVLDTTPAESFELENDSYMLENHAVHGVMDLTSVLRSRNASYRVAAGHIDDPRYREKLSTEIDGAMMAKKLRRQRIGVTGTPFVGMGDFTVRNDDLYRQFGVRVVPLPPQAIISEMEDIDNGDVAGLVASDISAYDTSDVADHVHHREARVYLAIKRLCERHGLTGYMMNFEHTGADLPPPFYAASKLMSDGYGYAGESDVITACLGGALGSINRRASFGEIFCVDWNAGEIMFSHMGEVNPEFARTGATRLAEKQALGHEQASAYFRFDIDPGPVTLVNIGVVDGLPSRIVCAPLELLDRNIAPGVDAPNFFARSDLDVATFLESYAEHGGGHHVYVVEGDVRSRLKVMCRYLDLDYSEVC